jgi:hypothetical protein
MTQFNPLHVQLQVSSLLCDFPELAEDEILRADMIEGSTDLFLLLSQIEEQRQEAVAFVEALNLRIAGIEERKARFERRDKALRKVLFSLLQNAGLPKAELALATLSVRAGTPKVIITDEQALPDALCRFKREPDKIKIKEALTQGHVTGATLSNAEPILSIRVK